MRVTSHSSDVGVAFARDLADHGERPALIAGERTVTYAELAERAATIGRVLGPTRRLVLLAAAWEVETVAAYLACLAGGHPVALVAADRPDHLEALIDRYDPDVVIHGAAAGADTDRILERRPGTGHTLHSELALLLSTSGSTGAPKLVRLSARNLEANAGAIATYLGLTPQDRAIGSLPMQYCYGLSVLHSHLSVGASIVLTDNSVVDPCFWSAVRTHGVTNLAGVPYTFELLDRVGFHEMDLPSLRFLTQAGGRLCPDAVRRHARTNTARGRRFVVMYGQTEATARMAYLPPEHAEAHPECIGIPIPGGRFELIPTDASDDPEVGELVFHGPNVMLGYAEGPEDLALGRVVTALHTGDLARCTPEGLYAVVGRRSRFLKLYGLRVDLDRLEALLRDEGVTAVCTGDDERLVVAVDGGGDGATATVQRLVTAELRLPAGAVCVVRPAELPRLQGGKPDYRAILALAAPPVEPAAASADVRGVFEQVLRRRDLTPESTFVGLGGDSLSYVEVSVRLEELLGFLPDGWHLLPLAEIEAMEPRRSRLRWMETNVVLRAAAIVLVAGSHLGAFFVLGGAHVLLAIAGFNFARFQLIGDDPPGTSRRILAAARRVAIPSLLWLTVLALTTGDYGWRNVLLLNHQLGPPSWAPAWNYWYIETLLLGLGLAALAFRSARVRRAERAHPFAFPAALLGLALVFRFRIIEWGPDTLPALRPHLVAWAFLIGWAAQRAGTTIGRLAVSAATVITVPGFFGDNTLRGWIVILGILALVWVPRVPVPRALNRPVGALASGSLYIYLTHFQVYPPLLRAGVPPWLTLAACLAVGLAAWRLSGPVGGALTRRWRMRRLQHDLRSPEQVQQDRHQHRGEHRVEGEGQPGEGRRLLTDL